MDIAIQYTALNYAAMMDQLTRIAMSSILKWGPILADMKAQQALGNYFKVGMDAAKIWTYVFGGTIMN